MPTIRITIVAENAAFDAESFNVEVARVLADATRYLQAFHTDACGPQLEAFCLRDVNGNPVGKVEVD